MIFGNKHKASDASGETVYTCPMHPEVQSNAPGKCPKCGMFLVAKDDAHHGGHDSGHKHGASDGASAETSSGCCGGKGHKSAGQASGGGCCGGHKDQHAAM